MDSNNADEIETSNLTNIALLIFPYQSDIPEKWTANKKIQHIKSSDEEYKYLIFSRT